MGAAMELSDILPDRFNYDKMRPPKLEGSPDKVFNHFTIMGLDSINENAMVFHHFLYYSLNVTYMNKPRRVSSNTKID